MACVRGRLDIVPSTGLEDPAVGERLEVGGSRMEIASLSLRSGQAVASLLHHEDFAAVPWVVGSGA
jgi:hypothetical protein